MARKAEALAHAGAALTQELLDRCHERAPGYDRDNRFFSEDYEELKKAGYLQMSVPKDFGGVGATMLELMRETRKLAYHAPATALGLNMHHYWVGVADDVRRYGDASLEWLLERAGAGDVFAAGHAETGNDLPVLLATTTAERVDGGYKLTGRKSFGSLTPVWDWMGPHALDASDPEAPKVVHSFFPRSAEGYHIKETWDVLGMRATRSDDTVLEGVFVPDEHVARVVPAGPAGIDIFVLAIFARALIGFANVYYGLATRARDIIVETVKDKGSIALTRSMAHHPEVQHGVAEMVTELEGLEPQLDKVAADWDAKVDYGMGWPVKIIAAKYRAVETCWRVVDRALDLSGGFGMFKKSELERLFRDARAGRFHPTNGMLSREFIGKLALGVDPAGQPRWG